MQRARTAAGFTLIEVLVAATLLATAAAGVATLMSVASLSTRAAREDTTAAIFASDKLEYLRSLGWPAVASSIDYPAGGVYVRRWSVQPLSADPGNALILQVWAGTVARPREVALTTILTRKGG